MPSKEKSQSLGLFRHLPVVELVLCILGGLGAAGIGIWSYSAAYTTALADKVSRDELERVNKSTLSEVQKLNSHFIDLLSELKITHQEVKDIKEIIVPVLPKLSK